MGKTASSGHFFCPGAISKKASILFVALWSIFFLGVLAIYLGYRARSQINLVNRVVSRAKLRSLATAGVFVAVDFIVAEQKEEKSFNALNEDWSSYPKRFKDIKLPGGSFSLAYEYFDVTSGAYQKRYGLIDESRKINIKLGNYQIDGELEQILRKLLEVAADAGKVRAQEIAASIVDWQDQDSQLSIPLGSAEDGYYRFLREPYESKDSDLEILDEIFLIKGINQAVFDKIKGYLTIYGDKGVNINTASRPVLLALGLPEKTVNSILSHRAGEDGKAATPDDNLFTFPANIVSELSKAYDLGPGELAILNNLISKGYLVTDSSYFMIKSKGRLVNQGRTAEITAVADSQGKIVYWREP